MFCYSFLHTHLYKGHIWFCIHNEVTNRFIHACNIDFLFNAYSRTFELFLVGVSMSIWLCSTYNTAGSPHPLGALRDPSSFINWRGDAPYSFTPGQIICNIVLERYQTCLVIGILFYRWG